VRKRLEVNTLVPVASLSAWLYHNSPHCNCSIHQSVEATTTYALVTFVATAHPSPSSLTEWEHVRGRRVASALSHTHLGPYSKLHMYQGRHGQTGGSHNPPTIPPKFPSG
jgi:hypothetical protein